MLEVVSGFQIMQQVQAGQHVSSGQAPLLLLPDASRPDNHHKRLQSWQSQMVHIERLCCHAQRWAACLHLLYSRVVRAEEHLI